MVAIASTLTADRKLACDLCHGPMFGASQPARCLEMPHNVSTPEIRKTTCQFQNLPFQMQRCFSELPCSRER